MTAAEAVPVTEHWIEMMGGTRAAVSEHVAVVAVVHIAAAA